MSIEGRQFDDFCTLDGDMGNTLHGKQGTHQPRYGRFKNQFSQQMQAYLDWLFATQTTAGEYSYANLPPEMRAMGAPVLCLDAVVRGCSPYARKTVLVFTEMIFTVIAFHELAQRDMHLSLVSLWSACTFW